MVQKFYICACTQHGYVIGERLQNAGKHQTGQVMPIKWIFFDCFNTIIDDFDHTGDESGIKPIAHIPVKHGLYNQASDFHYDYLQWRIDYWANGNQDEVVLPQRLMLVLKNGNRKNDINEINQDVIDEMMIAFHEAYPLIVRPTPGVEDVLMHFYGKVKMGVVSNFFLAGYPEQLLKKNGLDHYFDFIIDSAQVKAKKPGREIYEVALERAGVHQNRIGEILFVGDNIKNDVLIPMELGMRAIHFDRFGDRRSTDETEEVLSFHRWSDFRDIADRITT